MPPKRVNSGRAPRGAQKLTLDVLRAQQPGSPLSTSKIAKRIRKLSDRGFHKNSVYNALRILVRRGEISMVRRGRQKMYQIRTAISTSKGAASALIRRRAKPAPAPGPTPGMLPHKLGLGEILVLTVGSREVLTATNLHGRLVLERHPLPG